MSDYQTAMNVLANTRAAYWAAVDASLRAGAAMFLGEGTRAQYETAVASQEALGERHTALVLQARALGYIL